MSTDERDYEIADRIDHLAQGWLPVPDAAERLGTDAKRVRRMVQDSQLAGVRRTPRRIFSIPEDFLVPAEDGEGLVPIAALQGTLVVLSDVGLRSAEAVEWLLTPDDSLGGSPVAALRAGHKTEVRRRAQAL